MRFTPGSSQLLSCRRARRELQISWVCAAMPSSPGSSPTLSRSRSGAGSVGLASPSKRVNADAALQQLRAELLARSIDSTVPQPGHTGSKVRLPLDVFDNRDLERDTPMGWVSAATSRYAKRPNAAVLIYA